jgi:hypothetical protein
MDIQLSDVSQPLLHRPSDMMEMIITITRNGSGECIWIRRRNVERVKRRSGKPISPYPDQTYIRLYRLRTSSQRTQIYIFMIVWYIAIRILC